MKNNTVMIKLRQTLALTDSDIARIFELGGYTVTPEMIAGYMFGFPTDEGYIKCPSRALIAFLEGIIIDRRGPNPKKPKAGAVAETTIDNSDVFKKLRIAFDLHEDDIHAILLQSNIILEKNDFSAIFRKKGHKHYKVCSDPVLEAFFKGLAESIGK
jgi:uncharacterized protein YehS (DUF1456 family)